MDKQVQHIIALSAHLKASLNPIQFCELEEFSLLERFEQRSLVLTLRPLMVKTIEYPTFEQFLIAYSDFNRIAQRTSLFEPL